MTSSSNSPRRSSRLVARVRALLGRTGVGPPLLAALLVAHLVFGIARLATGAIHKRANILEEWFELGAVDWHYRHVDDETRRVVHWLLDTVAPDEVVLIDGDGHGQMQLLAPLLFPRLMVHASSARDGRDAAGRPLFLDHAPWHDATAGSVPVVVGNRWSLRVEYR